MGPGWIPEAGAIASLDWAEHAELQVPVTCVQMPDAADAERLTVGRMPVGLIRSERRSRSRTP